VIEDEGPETIGMVIAEPIQNAGGCLMPPDGYWPGVREICDRHGIVLVADEVISGCGRVGEWFAAPRYEGRPDVITLAKGLTSAYAPMGAVLVSEKVAEPFYRPKATLLHGITFGGHPLSAAIALKNIEIFEREGILDNVRRLTPYLSRQLIEKVLPLPIVGDVRGDGFFWAAELVRDSNNTRLDDDETEELVRGYLPRRILESGLIARPDDRGDTVLQIAPPLISDELVLDEVVDAMRDVLTDAGKHMGVERKIGAESA
jgi:adenosylmethionine-8-amino-7-oxononanoate aminotransferase